MRIKFVDGWKIRNTVETDFSQWGDNAAYPFIPKGEFWMDKNIRPEKDFFLELYKFERKMRGHTFREIRRQAQLDFCEPETKLEIIGEEIIKGLRVQYIHGETIRRKLDPYFILGGHDLVYSYIPKGHIWIDSAQDKREFKYTLVHEMHERELMQKSMDYVNAHDFALAAERAARRKDGVADFIRG